MAFAYNTMQSFVKNTIQPHIVNVKDLLEASMQTLKIYLIEKMNDLESRLTNYINTEIEYVISLLIYRPELPMGYISAYYGALDSSNTHPVINDKIYSDWYVCDGRNGTIDLRDKFIIGANNNFGDILGTESHNHDISVTISGSIRGTSLTVSNLPPHEHRFSDRHTGIGPNPSDKWTGANRTSVVEDVGIYGEGCTCNLDVEYNYTFGDLTYHDTESTGSGTSHTHDHSLRATGSSALTNNIPPCRALYYIMYKK